MVTIERQDDIKSVARAVKLLLFLATSSDPVTFTETREATGMGKATASRFLSTLKGLGMVYQNPETRKYRLGLAALRIGVAAGNQLELRHELRPYLSRLTHLTGETSNLVIWQGGHPVLIDNVESPNSLRMYSRIGRATYPYCTSVGKVFLAFGEKTFVREVLASIPFEGRTANSIISSGAFLKETERVRRNGFAVDDEESEIGARCVGAPVMDSKGQIIAAISISGPSSRIPQRNLPALGQMLRDVATEAGRSLGYAGSAQFSPAIAARAGEAKGLRDETGE